MTSHKNNYTAILQIGGFLLASIIIILLLFWHDGDRALVAMDAPLQGFIQRQKALHKGMLGVWESWPWLGTDAGEILPSLNIPVIYFVSLPWVTTTLFAVGFLLHGVAGYLLCRTLGLRTFPSAMGGLTLLLANNIFTLTYAGHVNKAYTCPWIIFAFTAFIAGLRNGRVRNYIGCGAFLGLACLSGEIQIAFYTGLWMIVWGLIWRRMMQKPGEPWTDQRTLFVVRGIALVGVTTLAVGFAAFAHYFNYLQTNAPVVGAQDTAPNWQFATQFYFPPEEVVSFFTTIQFFGAPFAYWGRCGSPMPLRLSDDYLGILPLGFAILGGIACWRIWQARLFLVMALGSLLISFGREGGLFWLLYQLPTMKAQRNPHRWTYFVALAVCVLAAYGVHWLWERLRATQARDAKDETRPPDWARWKTGLVIAAAVGALLFVAAGIMGLNSAGVAQTFYGAGAMASPQAPLFVERVRCLLFALTRTGFFLVMSAMAVWWTIAAYTGRCAKGEGKKSGTSLFALRLALPWAVILAVTVADLGTNAKRYLVFYPWRQALEENPLANFLREDKELYRVKAIGVQQNMALNNLVSNILPYHGISVVDPPAASRIPNDYGKLFQYLDQHYVRSDRYYDFFNIKYVLSPGAFHDATVPFVPIAQWNGINVYRREGGLPRAWLTPSARVIQGGDEAVLAAVLHPLTDLRQAAVLEEPPKVVPVMREARRSTFDAKPLVTDQSARSAKVEPAKTPGGRKGSSPAGAKTPPNVEPRTPNVPPGSVRVVRYEGNRVEMETAAAQPTLLVFGDKWDPDWKAWVDGQPTRILKANFLMRGVELPAGNHTVRMEYRPSAAPFTVSAVCVLLFAGYGIWRGARALGPRRNRS